MLFNEKALFGIPFRPIHLGILSTRVEKQPRLAAYLLARSAVLLRERDLHKSETHIAVPIFISPFGSGGSEAR